MQHCHLLGIQPRWQAAGQYRSGLQSSCQYNAKGASEGSIAHLHVAQQHSHRTLSAVLLCSLSSRASVQSVQQCWCVVCPAVLVCSLPSASYLPRCTATSPQWHSSHSRLISANLGTLHSLQPNLTSRAAGGPFDSEHLHGPQHLCKVLCFCLPKDCSRPSPAIWWG